MKLLAILSVLACPPILFGLHDEVSVRLGILSSGAEPRTHVADSSDSTVLVLLGSEYHTTAAQLGELAARANPKLLVISHNAQLAAADSIMNVVRRGFHGRVVMGRDLDRF